MRMRAVHAAIVDEIGLRFRPEFLRDSLFYAALLAAPLTLALGNLLFPGWLPDVRTDARSVAILVLWSPLIEEMLFRGVLQGQLEQKDWARRRAFGISGANALVSLLFVVAHLVRHAPLWAAATIVPSLLFGYFRERHGQIYPAIFLHAAYNACLLASGGA